MSLNMDDFRSSERTFDLSTQVTGRAGRAEKIGEAEAFDRCLQLYRTKTEPHPRGRIFATKEAT